MPVAWFLAPYKRRDNPRGVGRYCQMDDFTAQILADPEYAGAEPWAESECLGGVAVVKVRASAALLQTINQTAGFTMIPGAMLDNPLSSLTAGQKTTLRNTIVALGYTVNELQTALGTDLGAVTLGQLLRFVLTRRMTPRYDVATDAIVLNGTQLACSPIEAVDAAVA